MKKVKFGIFITLLAGLISLYAFQKNEYKIDESKLLTYIINPQNQSIQFFWKDTNHQNYKNFETLKSNLENQQKELVFAMNGGMYNKDLSPQGLYIENGEALSEIDTLQNSYGNFYLQPNGIFYLLNNNTPVICKTADYKHSKNIKYATQSGPMLLIDGDIHSKFNKGSKNVHIRNGVGILPNGRILFAMSKEKINFYDFATFFKQNQCKNALYLDGFVSRTYLPSKDWEQLDGNFGVIIAETKKIK